MSQPSQAIAIPRIEATASVAVILPPLLERQTEPLRAPPYVVDGEIVAAADDYQPPSPLPAGRWRLPALFGALAAVSLALGATLALVISPLLFASATITLTPEAHTLSTAVSIPLPVRLFPADHESLTRTIAATGIATRPATRARGSITFYNALPAAETIPAGTLLMGSSGVPVLTEQDADLPAASPPTEGATTVSAQAESTGSSGNIAAGTIGGPCCRAYVLAYNGGFSGGTDARTYRTPTPADIANALAPLRSQLDRRVQGALHAWLQPGEVLLPPTCDATTSTSAQPGAEADHITVMVRETCTAAAYNEGEVHQAATARLAALASHQFGPAYRLVGAAHAEITGATVTNGHATVHLQVGGQYEYSFSREQLGHLRSQLVGVGRDRARVILNHVAGVTQARIQSSSATLPGDPSRIHIVLSQGASLP
jgi:Baseplate J-like protein